MDTVEIIKAVVFGVVQGVTEWLPISSTGHMILLDEFLQLDMTPEFMEMFYVVIQLGAILEINPIVSTAIIQIGVVYSDIMKESVTLAI